MAHKHKDDDNLQSKSMGNFHNLELLCKVDEKQKKTLEKIIKHKPDLARSLNIYANGVKYFIAKQEQRNKLLQNIQPQVEEIVAPQLPLLTQRKDLRRTNKMRLMSESLERKQQKRAPSPINPLNYVPFALRQKVYIPALASPVTAARDAYQAKLKFNFHMGPGNNCELVKSVLLKRESHWSQVPVSFVYKHFSWQQSYAGMDYNKCNPTEGVYSRVMYNMFEYHKNITTKTGLTSALLNQLNSVEKTFSILPLAFIINFKLADWMKEVQQFTEFYLANNPTKNSSNKVTLDFDFYVSNLAGTAINRQGITKFKLQDTLLSESEYLWLLKPADWNRGEGVHVFSTLEELEALIKQYYHGKGNYECKEFVIQKYIEKPLLIEGRKFDIRCWALVTQDLQLYLFQEAYIRTSGQPFQLNSKDKFVHLTNNAVQKNATTYGQFESGNQLSLEQFQSFLDQAEGTKHNFRGEAWNVIKEVVRTTMLSAKLNRRNRKYCMQIFGYDFMIDRDFRVWLIEVNANPCLEESSPLLKQLIPRMLDDAFKLTIDKVFTPNYDFNTKFSVTGYKDDTSMWDYLGQCS